MGFVNNLIEGKEKKLSINEILAKAYEIDVRNVDSYNVAADFISKLSREELVIVKQCFKDDDALIVDWITDKCNTFTSEDLSILAKSDDINVLKFVAENPKTPESVLRNLLSNKEVHCELSLNDCLPEDVFEFLNQEDDNVALNIAKNPNTPICILEKLASHEGWRVRREVANNYKTNPKTLEKLSFDMKGDVRISVAKNWNTPIDVLEKLALDKAFSGDFIREGVARNPNTPISVLKKLAEDNDQSIRLAAKRSMFIISNFKISRN